MNFSSMEVSFFKHFPHLTISLTNFYLKSSAPFSDDTLISAKDISFGVDLVSLFKGPIRISKVYLNRGRVIIQYNDKGLSNFDVYKTSSGSTKTADTTSSGSADLQIEDISFARTDFVYSDPSIPLKLAFFGLDYKGNSNISNDILKLRSKISIDSMDFVYDRVSYIKSKPVKAKLTTSINLNSLDMKFEKNDFTIRDVPFEFRGEMNFRKDGYSLFVSLYSMFQNEWISGSVYLVANKNLWIAVKSDISLELEKWAKRLDVKDYDMKGAFRLKLNASGEYITGQNPASKKPDTVVLSIPDFTFSSNLKNGYFKFKSLPNGMEGISFDLTASSTNHDYRTINLQLENIKASVMKNHLEGYFRIKGLEDLPVESKISTRVDLAELQKVVPIDSLNLQGMLGLEISINGKYNPQKKLFPVTNAVLTLNGGVIQTKFYPRPIEKINLQATVTNNSGKVEGTKVKVDELSFLFEGNPFRLTAEIANPDNVDYKILAKGSINIANIYKVFAKEGMELNGFISANLNLQGRQSDALAGNYGKLHNTGTLGLKNIAFKTTYLPDQLLLKSGVFRFHNDSIWFEKFESRYGKSDIMLNGNISNVVNYFLAKNQVLQGNFKFYSDYLLVDEFFKPAAVAAKPSAAEEAPISVIVIPPDLDITLNADLRKIRFEKTDITNFLAAIEMNKGILALKNMKFEIVGCKAGMEASYQNTGNQKASFDFHVNADEFDIKRAYNEIELFRNLVASAEKCEGIVSLDYSLKGKLDAGMNPIYPSLEGGGVLSVKKVKVMGMALFTAMSSNLGKEKIKNPDLSKVELKTTIKNNIITLEQTKMKISGFRLRISGETSFDGKLNLKTRLGLPPLGIIGIPMRILGTTDQPKFKYGRGNNDENLEESVYSDELSPDLLEKIKNSKEEDDGNE